MTNAFLEHVNITVADPEKTAKTLCDLFDWRIRWQGDAIAGGKTFHVGEENSYIAIYNPKGKLAAATDNYQTRGGLNHIAIVVDDLEDVESRVVKAGFKPINHADYEPGRRFYFYDDDQIEYEVVSY